MAADQRIGHRSQNTECVRGMKASTAASAVRITGSRTLHRGLDDGVIVIKAGRTVLLDLFVRISVIRIRIPARPIRPRIAFEPEGLVEVSNVGTTPTRPSAPSA